RSVPFRAVEAALAEERVDPFRVRPAPKREVVHQGEVGLRPARVAAKNAAEKGLEFLPPPLRPAGLRDQIRVGYGGRSRGPVGPGGRGLRSFAKNLLVYAVQFRLAVRDAGRGSRHALPGNRDVPGIVVALEFPLFPPPAGQLGFEDDPQSAAAG